MTTTVTMQSASERKSFDRSSTSTESIERDAPAERSSRLSSVLITPSKHAETPPTSRVPSPRLTRKMTAEMEDELRGADKISRRVGENTNSQLSQVRAPPKDSPTPKICLCQPDPKIPRPRNAFILYRQHHQTGMIARHPGLTHPEISKIMGERWRNESDQVKDEWKELAEEERRRHAQQYPDYRYQPKRANDRKSISQSPTTVGGHCLKCGGRIMQSPMTPLSDNSSRAVLPPPPHMNGVVASPDTSNRHVQYMDLTVDSPHEFRSIGRPLRQILNAGHVRKHSDEKDRIVELSPEANKRRRFASTGTYVPVTSRPYPGTPYPMLTPFRDSFHSRSSWTPPGIHAMAPPPRPSKIHQPDSQTHDPRPVNNITLPPIQTNGSSHDLNRSVEAMVMSMPYIGKIKVLSRISPPIKLPGPGSPPFSVRGVLVAVEGDDARTIDEIVNWLEEFLDKDGQFSVRAAQGPVVDMKEDVTIKDYHAVIGDWRDKNDEIVSYITTPPVQPERAIPTTIPHSELPGPPPDSPLAPPATTTTTTTTTTPPTSNSPNASPTTQTPPVPPISSTVTRAAPSSKIPILLLRGYQLAASNTYASRIAIQDHYSPTDHWQWMATMWRGIVGPDITIFCKDADAQSASDTASGGGVPSAGIGLGISKDPRDKQPAVELREDAGCIVVRKEGDRVEERALRRLGFEVGEWLRAIGFSKGGAEE